MTTTSEVMIRALSNRGEKLSACFLPGMGMNFISYKKGDIEAIDLSTKKLFDERYAGLGAMIGPHFHHRNPSAIPPIDDPSLFPHIARVQGNEPFSHGIGRYAPWKVESVGSSHIKSVLKGDDTWHGIPLKALEGQDFLMEYEAKMTPLGLEIHLSVKGETQSVVGLHTYYALINGKGRVLAPVQSHYNDQGILKPIPSTWNYGEDHTLTYKLETDTDYGFHPFPDLLHGSILLETGSYQLQVQYWCNNEENSWQLWHPKAASFVCIEPIAAKDPRKPRLSTNHLKILISIL
ncbi:MAG: hypothetical protein WAM28_03655 [Chlamydiales bacterium]